MNHRSTRLESLWRDHSAKPFPRSMGENESSDVDYFSLVSLDSGLAGWISRIAEGEHLSMTERHQLEAALSSLQTVLPALAGGLRDYFTSLAEVARAAIDAERFIQ